MELSDPESAQASPSPNDATHRRKSGRVKHQPVLLQNDPNISIATNSSTKRKRAATLDQGDINGQESQESSLDESDGDPDEEELKEKRRKSRSKKAVAKPAPKKAKMDKSSTTHLPLRPAINGIKKPSKPKRPQARPNAALTDAGTGLYSEIFAQGHTVEGVAAEWITRYDQHNANAMCALINFVLKCTGCDLQVNIHDIEDPDNAASKLEDLQDEYQAQNITDYPLLSKNKGYASFRSTLTSFIYALITTAHAAGVLYSDLALIENIQVWVTAMSSCAIRPFRHTATVICLTMQSALCNVFSELADNTAKTVRQKDGEQKRKTVNKERVASLQDKVAEGERKSELVDHMMEDIFSAVYMHRYRDVDPKVRTDCVTALGDWITTAPEKFFTSNYLRYLGWVVSDPSASTRAEVVKQLSKLYKKTDDIGRYRTFTERFRPRFVEMAIQDAEASIRASAITMLDLIRETGLLEPDDIDNVGRLIFDTEAKVRKAVSSFFGENVNDLFDQAVEELGGEEGIAEAVGDGDSEDFDIPRKSWLKFKCLAETLHSYHSDNEEGIVQPPLPQTSASLLGQTAESRISLAAQAVYDGVPDVKEWETLAGYLLYDTSSVALNGNGPESPESQLRRRCQLNDGEAMLLLEVLNAAVKRRLLDAVESESDKKGKKSKARVEEAREVQERVALHLAQVVPRLLRKFGGNPATASIVLRLEHVLNLEIFEELRQDSTIYASLLDEINKQFLTHVDQGVLAEASNSLLHARSFEDLEEITESKVQELWSDTINTLRTILGEREGGKPFDMTGLCNTVFRISSLASISDCVIVFETEQRSTKNSSPAMTAAPSRILANLINDEYADVQRESSEEIDGLITSSIKSLLFYNMWFVRSLKMSPNAKTSDPSSDAFSPFTAALFSLMQHRSGTDPLRLAATGAYLDFHTLYASLRNTTPHPKDQSHTNTTNLTPPSQKTKQVDPNTSALPSPYLRTIPPQARSLILTIFTAAEKQHARKSHRKIELPPSETSIEDAPESDDGEDEDDEDDADPAYAEHNQTQKLVAEQTLCELTGKIVLALIAGVLDTNGEGNVKKRILRNKMKLGPNFKEVLAFLDEPKSKARGKVPPKGKAEEGKGAAGAKGGKKAKSKEVVSVSSELSSEAEEAAEEEEVEEEVVNGELVGDRIEDVDKEEGGRGGPRREEDEIMGD
ncbi:MAG: hypothetical protein Q9220_000700 [cf. Caloplaca sp. 1 TL-2023]